jgi:membrane-associated PAP2 superfamily phosphatase
LAKDLLDKSVLKREKVNLSIIKVGWVLVWVLLLMKLIKHSRRRALRAGDDKTTYVCQTLWIIPSITGKVELVYEGEQEGAAYVAQNLIASAIHTFQVTFLKSRSWKARCKNSLYWFNRMVLLKAVSDYWTMLQMKNTKEF